LKRLAPLALALAVAAPAAAQDRRDDGALALPSMTRFANDPPLSIARRGFSFPIVEYTDPKGARVQRRGIIASKEVAPGASVGVGLLDFVPKSQGFSPERDGAPKRKRRAAIGFSLRF
jgi:hypothetical protein